MDKLTAIATVVHGMRHTIDAVEDRILARAIGTVIFDIPTTRSGLVSVGLLCPHGYRPPVSQCTEEHFHSRNESGYALIEIMRDGGTLTDVVTFLQTATMVHLTTKAENIRLSAIQNHPVTRELSWQEQYDMAGIELVEDPGTMPRALRKALAA